MFYFCFSKRIGRVLRRYASYVVRIVLRIVICLRCKIYIRIMYEYIYTCIKRIIRMGLSSRPIFVLYFFPPRKTRFIVRPVGSRSVGRRVSVRTIETRNRRALNHKFVISGNGSNGRPATPVHPSVYFAIAILSHKTTSAVQAVNDDFNLFFTNIIYI